MNKLLIFLTILKFNHGFLLDNGNTSLPVKQTYLTVAEYYGDRSRLHHEQETYRDQQEQALKLLANQLQQRLMAMEQKINEKNESHQQSLTQSEQNFKELERKYTSMKETVGKWEQKYQELEQKYQKLEQNFTTLGQTLKNQNQTCLDKITVLQNEIDILNINADQMTNKTKDLQQEVQQLKNLKTVNQLQTLSNLANKVNTFDSRISLLSGHEQSRNQDFLALYNLTTATSSKVRQMEAEYNTSLLVFHQKEEQNRYNFTNKLDVLANITSKKMDKLANITSKKMDTLYKSQNLSVTQLRETIQQNNEKVVLVACNAQQISYNRGATYKFSRIVTKVGLPHLTAFPSTGKFVSPDNGIYHISAVLTTLQDNVIIEIMKNSVSVHQQYINGYSHSGIHWTPGTAIIA